MRGGIQVRSSVSRMARYRIALLVDDRDDACTEGLFSAAPPPLSGGHFARREKERVQRQQLAQAVQRPPTQAPELMVRAGIILIYNN